MDARDDAGFLQARVVWTFFASMLAPKRVLRCLVGPGLPATPF
jgi:hypothetical protein